MAGGKGSPENRAYGDDAGDFVSGDGGEPHGSDAAAGGAIRIAAELAGSDLGYEIGGEGLGGEGEDAVPGAFGRSGKLGDGDGRHVEFGENLAEFAEIGDDLGAFGGCEHFGQAVAELGCEEAEPDFADFRARGPEFEKVAKVAGTLHHLPGDGAVDGDGVAGDVLEDTIIGGRRAADVVLRLESVDGDDDGNMRRGSPGGGGRAEGAGYDLDVDAARKQKRDELLQFAVADEGIAADDGEVEGLEAVNGVEDAIDEGLAFAIAERAKGYAAAEMGRVIGITSRATQGAFLGDLDR